jgi:uncharacterized Zn-finger protein
MVTPWLVRALRGLPAQLGPSLVTWGLLAGVAWFGVSQVRGIGGEMMGRGLTGAVVGDPAAIVDVVNTSDASVSEVEQFRASIDGEQQAQVDEVVEVVEHRWACALPGRVCRFEHGRIWVEGECPEWRELPECGASL